MIRKFRALGLALAACGLFACNQEDKNPVQPAAGGQGSARLQLPALPAGYLAKSGAAKKAPKALFALTVSGNGMQPIHKTWSLSSTPQAPVIVAGIPAGNLRVFQGRLIRIDSTGDTTVTHEGSDSAWIFRDQVSEIRLYLREGGSGSAHICVEVEGWPADPSCFVPPDTLPHLFVGGCYNLEITKPAPNSWLDTVFKAKLNIHQWDTSLSATVTWPSGAMDSSLGQIFPSGTVYLGLYQGQFRFKAWVDSSGILNGDYYDSTRQIWGFAHAYPAPCDSDTIIVPPHNPVRACFAFKQIITGGKTTAGRVGFETSGEGWAGVYTHWDGFASAYTVGITGGNLEDTSWVEYGFRPPPGMFPAAQKIDSASYTLNLGMFDGTGKVMKMNPPTKALGRWEGVRASCLESDFQL